MAKISVNPVFYGKILIFIILNLSFYKKKKKMLGLRKNYVIITITKNELINFDIELRGNYCVFCHKKIR